MLAKSPLSASVDGSECAEAKELSLDERSMHEAQAIH